MALDCCADVFGGCAAAWVEGRVGRGVTSPVELAGLRILPMPGEGLGLWPGERIPGLGPLMEGLPPERGAVVVGFFGLKLRPTVDKRGVLDAAVCVVIVARLAAVDDVVEVAGGANEVRLVGVAATLCLGRATGACELELDALDT